jgi:TonB family protein
MKLINYFLIGTLLALNFACSGVYTYDDPNYTPPSITYKPRIIYPDKAKENNWKGKSVILVKVSDEGNVISTSVYNSSGHDILDNTAKGFCKNLKFNPALNNEEPIQSYIKMHLEFNFNLDKFNIEEYVKEYVDDIISLYAEVESNNNIDKTKLQNKILVNHKNFISQTRDASSLSQYINLVIQPKIASEWEGIGDLWPLSFLLYHDFLDRYQNFAKADSVKIYLYLALKEDVNYIINTPSGYSDKETVLNEIYSFMKKEYPDINIDSIDFNVERKTKLVI